MSDYRLIHGDCLDEMRTMEAGSIDAIVCDPPYGLEFMGKDWDAPWKTGTAEVGFTDGGNRRPLPQHGSKRNPICRTCGDRQRGKKKCECDVPNWDIGPQDNNRRFQKWTEAWAVEAFRVLKPGGRMLAFAGSRMQHRTICGIEDAGFIIEDVVMWLYGQGFPKHRSKLKPSYEPIVVARKGGVSDLNIDAGRIGFRDERPLNRNGSIGYGGSEAQGAVIDGGEGRWPANVALDEEAARALDEMSGELSSGRLDQSKVTAPNRKYGEYAGKQNPSVYQPDSGGASRFFYTSKASRAERERGLTGATRKPGGSTVDGFTEDKANGNDRNRPVLNHHPTVKPVDLMRWLIRLVAKPGETVLDPFMGSGTTGVAATLEGVGFVGIEREAEYLEIARRRIAQTQPSLFADGAA